ncbi:TPA: hypothetical protein JLL53_003869 [Escherichia coli]|nr:hypothetical protein [Escherichia coli]
MSDNNLRLQVILNAVDKLTRPFRSAQASSKELACASNYPEQFERTE